MAQAVEEALGLLRRDPRRTCVITDFDGTLAAIVENPAAARPLAGAPEILARLAGRYGRVAVVSGRPASFLADHLVSAPGSGVLVSGLYGLESLGPDGVVVAAEAEPWRGVVDQAAAGAGDGAPDGLVVEHKGLSVTLHWRGVPEAAGWARRRAEELAGSLGLVTHPGRSSVELRPPVGRDKGTVVAGLAAGYAVACYLGDDVGDLPAFAALDELSRAGAVSLKVAVASPEVPHALIAAADLVVGGPEEALAFLAALVPPEA